MPRIAAPADAAQARVNAALAGLEAAARTSWASCRAEGGQNAEWQRHVATPMRGPRFLSVVVTDDVYCGGPHPNVSMQAVVYDLRTGQPVDWTTLLPPALVGTPTLERGADEVRTVRIGSKALSALFLSGYSHEQADAECRRYVTENLQGLDQAGFSVWPDAASHALVLQRNLPHVMQACDDAVAVPAATLQHAGVRGVLMDAITGQ